MDEPNVSAGTDSDTNSETKSDTKSDANSDASNESPFSIVQTPRLSIFHLMLWTFCTAVYLSLFRAVSEHSNAMAFAYENLQYATIVLQGAITGAIFAGSITLIITRVRSGPPMLRQPGHWVLFVTGCVYVVYVPVLAVMLLDINLVSNNVVTLVVFALIMCVPPIAYAFAVRDQRILRWKALFVALVVVTTAQFLPLVVLGLLGVGIMGASWISAITAIAPFGSLLIAAAMLVIAVVELFSGNRRDWLHWTGVLAYVASASINLIWLVRTLIS
jgi:hypothetical protein